MQEIPLGKSYSKRIFTASFAADPELWSRFKGECAARGVSICYVLEALMEAWIQPRSLVTLRGSPVTVNLTMQHVVKRPRRAQSFEDMIYYTQHKIWPPSCEKADQFIKSTKEVGCLDARDWVPLDRCWRCFIDRH